MYPSSGDSSIVVVMLFALIGVVGLFASLIYGIYWLFRHIQII